MRLVISPLPEPLDFPGVRNAYDTVAEDYATHLPDTRAEALVDLAMVDAFAEAVTSGDDAQVLDAGCGAGRMSPYLAERGCLVRGVDLSSSMIAMARRDHRDVVFTVGSVTDLPYSDNEFAGVLFVIRSSTRLRPGGLAAAGGNRVGPGERGEGSFVTQPVRVVACADEDRRGSVRADTFARHQLRGDRGGDTGQPGLCAVQLLVQELDALGKLSQRQPGHRGEAVVLGAHPEGSAGRDELRRLESAQS